MTVGEQTASGRDGRWTDWPAVQYTSAWQEASRIGLVDLLDHDARPSVLVDLHAVDASNGNWGRLYTNAAYETTPTSETWTKFERDESRRVYTGPPNLRDWAYGPAPSPDPTPIVHSDIWVVSRVTLRSRWRIVSAVKRNPQDEGSDIVIPSQTKPIPIPSTRDDFAQLRHHTGGNSPQSWSRMSDMARSLSGARSPFMNPVDAVTNHSIFKGIDWSQCALGPPEVWPRWMKQFASMVMADLDPAIVVWKDRTVIYNEQVVPLIAQKHPSAMGSDAAISFSELWPLLEPMIEAVHRTHKPRRIEAMPLPMLRRGYLEETFWTFTLVPVFNEEGEVEGVLDRFSEVTMSMIAARRMDQISQISERTSEATSLEELWSKVMYVMEYHTNDTPFALLYSLESGSGHVPSYSRDAVKARRLTCQLKGSVGAEDHMDDSLRSFNMADTDNCVAGLARQAFEENKPVMLRSNDGSLPEKLQFAVKDRGFGDVVNAAVILPIVPTTGKAIGVLVKALNPRRMADTDYYSFMRLLTRKLGEAFASVFLPIEERNYRAEVEKAAMEQANLSKQLLIRTREAEHNAAAFARLTADAPIGMYMYSAEGAPVYLNDYYFKLTGLARDSFDQLTWMDGVHPTERDRLMQQWNSLYHDKLPVTFEFRMNRSYVTTDQDGAEVAAESWALASAFPQLDDDGEIINVIGWQIDISPHKWAQNLQKERLKDALESRSQAHRFIDMVSHECRNPLSAILQSADGILTAIGSLEDEPSEAKIEILKDCIETVADSAQTIVLCAQHQKRIVDDILTVSKLDGNHLLITPDKADPVGLVEHVLKMYEAELEADSIQAEVIILDGYKRLEVDYVLLDPSRVLQILINMVTNAIKFTAPSKRRKIVVSVDASLKRPVEGLGHTTLIPQRSARLSPATTHPEWANGRDLYVQFSVKDTGRGMSPEEMAKLFERFAQASPRTHVKYGGSGLGLFISRELTELQGGQVSVSSTLGIGSTFAFFVNARRSADPAKNSQTPTYTPGPASNGSGDHLHSPAFPFPHIPSSSVPYSSSAKAATSVAAAPTSVPTSFLGTSNTRMAQSLSAREEEKEGKSAGTPSSVAMAAPAVTSIASAVAARPVEKLHVLIVEDNIINQKVTAKQLQRVGCTVHVANHGVEALDFLKKSEFSVFPPCICPEDDRLDVILMDIEMPVMDGVTCVREIRAMQRRGELLSHVPIIAVTANARDAQQAEARENGMDTVVTKPFRIPELVPKMVQLVAEIKHKRREQQNGRS